MSKLKKKSDEPVTHLRKYHKTPHGGDYSEIHYLDDQSNVVDSSAATRCVILEFKMDGTFVYETWGYLNRKKPKK